MQKAMTIVYEVGKNLYLNLTNRCPCRCTFCLRTMADGAYGTDPLWLDHEPSQEEIANALSAFDVASYPEVVFCGYGEPTERLDVLLETAKILREKGVKKIRLNTNGLSDLIHGEKTASKLAGLIDVVSISLNAGTEAAYLAVTRPKFGEGSFAAMQEFAVDCKAYVPQVMMTVVDGVLSEAEMTAAKELTERLGVTLRIRPFENADSRREK